jgi:hypothetical protein
LPTPTPHTITIIGLETHLCLEPAGFFVLFIFSIYSYFLRGTRKSKPPPSPKGPPFNINQPSPQGVETAVAAKHHQHQHQHQK